MHRDRLSVIQHNVQGWSNNRISLSNIYNTIDPDIILLNETSIRDQQTLKIFNYNTYATNHDNEQYAGAAIAIKKSITAKIHDNFYSNMLAATIETSTGPITIATAYVPPRENYLNFIDFNKIFKKNTPVYFLGDINAAHSILGHTHNNNRGRHLYTLIQENKCQHIGPHFTTWMNHNRATAPDIVLKNNRAFHNIHLQPGPITPSDHIPIIATISTAPIQIPITPRKSFHRANWELYRQELGTVECPNQPHPTLQELEDHIKNFNHQITQTSNTAIPTLTHRTIPGIRKTRRILQLERQYKDIKHIIDTIGPTIQHYRQIIYLRQQLRQEYREEYNTAWNKIISETDKQKDARQFHKAINNMMGNNKNQQAPYIKHNGQYLHLPQQREPIFRQHWKDIFTDADPPNNHFNHQHIQNIEIQTANRIPELTPYPTGDNGKFEQNTFPPITVQELGNTIKSFKQKAPGPSDITTEQLKQLPQNMIKYLLYILNHSLTAGYFPTAFKTATMIFIPKPGKSPHTIQNYRPISLLDIQAKIFDKIINNRITEHLEEHNHTNPKQHGFRKYRGTHTAIATFYETIAKDLTNKHKIDIVLRDLSKAFDKVWHIGLKHKLLNTTLHPNYIKTIASFLTNRTAQIRIAHHLGPTFSLQSGVPQGSCLSPTLFNLYTHDIPEPLPNTDYIAYADDITQIISTPGTHNTIALNTERAIEQINQYENKWKIQTNTTKFEIINIARQKTRRIRINNTQTEYKSNGRMLGLYFSNRGISKQLTIRKAIATTTLQSLYRFKNLSTENKRKLYLTYIRPKLTYPPIPIHTASKKSISSLQKVQNKALRLITNTRWTDFKTNRQIHEETNIPPLNIYLHQQAQNTWNKIEVEHPQLYQQLEMDPNNRQHYYFPSSRLKALQNEPAPQYH